jgi:serine/threonine protein kinase
VKIVEDPLYSDEKFIMKIIRKIKYKQYERSQQLDDFATLGKLDHSNLVKLVDLQKDKKNFYMINEYCEQGLLCDYILELRSLSEMEVINMIQ